MTSPTTRQTGRNGSLAQRLRSSGTETSINIDVASDNNFDNKAGVIKINNGTSAEWCSFTGVTTGSTANGVTRQTLTGVTRGLKKNATSLTDNDVSIKQDHSVGTSIKLVHHSAEINKLAQNDADNTLSGDNTFSGNNYFQSTANGTLRVQNVTTAERTGLTGISDGHIVYDTDFGQFFIHQAGAWYAMASGSTQPNASTTGAGKVEEATLSEIGASTAIGGTGAKLFMTPAYVVGTSAGAGDADKLARLDANGKLDDTFINNLETITMKQDGRLTFTTGVPVQIANGTAYTNIYYTPYIGDKISIYDGSNWVYYTFTERTLSLASLAIDKNYDVYIYDNSGTLTLESVAWTNDTTRATALVRQNGVLCKTGALTHRYLGTFRTTGTIGQSAWSTTAGTAKLLLWNMYNRREAFALLASSSGGSGAVAWRAYNNNTNNSVQFVCGVQEDAYRIFAQHAGYWGAFPSGNTNINMGLGIDTTGSTTTSSDFSGTSQYGDRYRPSFTYSKTIAEGEHILTILEQATYTTNSGGWGNMTGTFNFPM